MHTNPFTYIYTVRTHPYYLTPTPSSTLESVEHTIDATIEPLSFIIHIAFQWISNEKKK